MCLTPCSTNVSKYAQCSAELTMQIHQCRRSLKISQFPPALVSHGSSGSDEPRCGNGFECMHVAPLIVVGMKFPSFFGMHGDLNDTPDTMRGDIARVRQQRPATKCPRDEAHTPDLCQAVCTRHVGRDSSPAHLIDGKPSRKDFW